MPETQDDFIGRDADLARLRGLLGGPARLVTIVGGAGLGKTRLALELARLEQAVVVRLSDARTIDDVIAAVAAAFEVPPAATNREATAARVARAIAARGELVLVLDNFEQLTPLAPPTIARWLAQAGALRVVVTSREVLRLEGEWLHEVMPLSLVADDAREPDAVRLLRSRIERARGGAPVGDAATELLEIARCVDGIPLALELAAQRVVVFGAEPVLARLGSFLDFLSDGRRDAAPDRRTLRDTIAWSWSLLGPHERAALAQCAVFPGWFDAASAERVVALADGGDVLATVQALREKSLVLGDASVSSPGTARFRLLVPIREFARDQLSADEADQAHARHAAWLLDRAERRAGELRRRSLLVELERDRDDLIAILTRARLAGAAGRPTLARAIRAIAPLVLARGPVQPLLEAIEAIAPEDAGDPRTAVDLALLHARLLRRVGRIAEAEALFERLLADGRAPAPYLHGEVAYCRFSVGRVHEAVDRWARARAARAELMPDDSDGEGSDMVRMAFALRELGRLDEAETLATEARSIARRRGDLGAEATATTILAVVAVDRGAAARGLRLGGEAVELARATTSSFFEGIALSALAMAHHISGELAEVEALLRPCQTRVAAVGLSRLDAGALTFLGILAWEQGDLARARAQLEDALDLLRAIGDVRYAAHTIAALGAIDADEGHLAAAAHRFAELPPSDGLPLSGAVAVHRLHLDLAAARAAELAGDARTARRLREAIHTALAEPPLGYEWRVARRLCLTVVENSGAALVVRGRGATCMIGETAVDLGRRTAARALLLTLAQQRLENPGRPVSWSELVAAGWPDERMLPHAARNRVKVTIAWLRRAGFRELIQSDDRGYWLHRSARVGIEPAVAGGDLSRD